MMAKLLKNEKGSVIIIIALVMTALLGFMALTVDYGNLYMNRTELTKAADAAALAGAGDLPDYPASARATAASYATSNGQTGDVISATTPDDYTVNVTISRTVPMLFAKVMGINTKAVSAHSKVAVGYASTVPEIVPFAVALDQINKLNSKEDMWNNQYTMRLPPNGDITAYGTYEMDYCNVVIAAFTQNSQYLNALTYGYDQTFTIGQNMYYYGPSAGGQSAVDALATRMTLDPVNDYTQARRGTARVLLVPVVYSIYYKTDSNGNYIMSNGHKVALSTSNGGDPMPIIGFVAVYLQSVKTSNGSNCSGTAWRGYVRFLKDFNLGTGTVITPNATYYYGVLGSQLVQ